MRFISPLKAYILSVPATALTAWILLLVQNFVAHVEGGHVRPFGSGFLLTVAVLTILGGRGPGVLTLLLSTAVVIFYLTPLGSGGGTGRPRDMVELILLLFVGGALIRGLESLRGNALLLADSEEARARLRAVMDTAPVGVVLSDPGGNLLYANLEAERIWGQTLESIQRQGEAAYEIFNPDGSPASSESVGLRRALAGEPGVVHVDVLVEHRDKTRIFVESDSTVVRDKNGRILSGLVVFSDVTERKRAEQEVQRLLARERLISKIGQISLQTLDPDLIQSEAAAGLTHLLGADRVFFTLHDGGEDSFYTPGQTLVVPDVSDRLLEKAIQEMMVSEKIQSAIITPLFDSGHLAATLNVAMTQTPRFWEPSEVGLVEAVAAQTRAALEAARAQKREYTIAVALQDALIPSLPKRVPGLTMASYYKAALAEANVGGDFLDVFALEEGQAVFAVGDLSGKGLAAAAQVATIRNMLRYSLYRTPSLGQAISELNRTIVAHDLLTGFATLFVGIYESGSRRLTYLSCGHDPSLLRRASGGEIALLPPVGTEVNAVLGLTEEAVFYHQSVTLAAGDTLFFCTDGVTEAGRNRGEFLGVAGVAALLQAGKPGESPEELIARIVADVREYAQGEMHDDVCLLAAIVSE
jgi:PAS domain S-box-containing protein